ncbi:hypothetical protein ACOMHN_051816 [Nucella lapillus]
MGLRPTDLGGPVVWSVVSARRPTPIQSVHQPTPIQSVYQPTPIQSVVSPHQSSLWSAHTNPVCGQPTPIQSVVSPHQSSLWSAHTKPVCGSYRRPSFSHRPASSSAFPSLLRHTF